MKNLAYSVIGIAGIITLLIVAKGILIPFICGVILWFLSRYFKSLVLKIPLVKKHFPTWVPNVIVFILLIVSLVGISGIITASIDSLLESYDNYESNIDNILASINQTFDIDIYKRIQSMIKDFDYRTVLSGIADSITSVLSNTVMIVIYAAFIFSEEASFLSKIKRMFTDSEDFERISAILSKINNSVSEYIKLKTYVSLLTGTVGYVFLLIMDIDAPFFWAFLLFLLNYIPTVGSLIATLFPAVFSLIQFGDFTPFIIILVVLGVIEWVIGNVLEPKIMGSSLNLSPLVTILALIVWGQIWGIIGMLLSVPITVVMVIVFTQFDSTRNIAILLSEKGEIEDMG